MILYIMGRPHCGSTILDIMLGNASSIESVGEMTSNLYHGAKGQCSCGENQIECPFWHAVAQKVEQVCGEKLEDLGALIRSQAHIKHYPSILIAGSDPQALSDNHKRLALSAKALGDAITQVAQKPHMLDSTKEATRALFLLKYVPDTRLIHLVRDPRQTVASHYWRFKKDKGYFHFLRRKYHAPWMLLPFMITSASAWLVGNLLCEINGLIGKDRVLRIRYEDLSHNTLETLNQIENHFGIPLEDVRQKIQNKEELAIGHNIGGNRVRLQKSLVFKPDQKKYSLPFWLNALTLLISWPLMLRYDYPVFSSSTTPALAPKADV